jgi:hypothetical protein
MSNIQLNSDFNSYVLIWLFQDAMRKMGRSKKAIIKDINYDVVNGLVVTDEDDIVWEIETHAKIKIPEELKKSRVPDNETECFCVDCTIGIKEAGLCHVCKYLNRV